MQAYLQSGLSSIIVSVVERGPGAVVGSGRGGGAVLARGRGWPAGGVGGKGGVLSWGKAALGDCVLGAAVTALWPFVFST